MNVGPKILCEKSRWLLVQCKSPVVADSVEKVEVSTRPDFFSAVDAVFRRGRGGPHNPLLTQPRQFQIGLRRQLASIEDVVAISADLQRL